MTRAEILRAARLKAGLTQKQVGEKCGYTHTAQRVVYRWESGIKPVPRSKIIKLAAILNINPLKLL